MTVITTTSPNPPNLSRFVSSFGLNPTGLPLVPVAQGGDGSFAAMPLEGHVDAFIETVRSAHDQALALMQPTSALTLVTTGAPGMSPCQFHGLRSLGPRVHTLRFSQISAPTFGPQQGKGGSIDLNGTSGVVTIDRRHTLSDLGPYTLRQEVYLESGMVLGQSYLMDCNLNLLMTLCGSLEHEYGLEQQINDSDFFTLITSLMFFLLKKNQDPDTELVLTIGDRNFSLNSTADLEACTTKELVKLLADEEELDALLADELDIALLSVATRSQIKMGARDIPRVQIRGAYVNGEPRLTLIENVGQTGTFGGSTYLMDLSAMLLWETASEILESGDRTQAVQLLQEAHRMFQSLDSQSPTMNKILTRLTSLAQQRGLAGAQSN